MTEAQPLSTGVTIRSYESGDETKIVDLLNLCYGEWGGLDKWRALYANYPSFSKDDVFVAQDEGEIIGHRGLHFRDVDLGQGRRVPTVSLGDTAVHPRCRGLGLYARLHQATLQAAKSRGASLAFTWNLKGSTTYNHNITTGFIELGQARAYMRIVNPARVLRRGLSDFVHKNQKLRNVLHELEDDLNFSICEAEFSVAELLGEGSRHPGEGREGVKLVFTESSLPLLINFRTMSKLERIRGLALLFLCQRVKVISRSPVKFLKVVRKGLTVLGSL